MIKSTHKTVSLFSVKSNINLKRSAFSLLIFTPLFTLAQLSGIWYGELENDSTHRKQSFEIGLSEYRGKITGFTYTTFISNDTFYFSVKRIKAERKDSVLVVVDDEMLYNNFPERAAKGVKQTTVFPLINDSTIDITKGRWSTNQTKKYYSIAGSAVVKEVKDKDESELVSHLQEIKVKNNLAVRNPEKHPETAVVKTNVTQRPQQKQTSKSEIKKESKSSPPVVANESVVQQKPEVEKKTSTNEVMNVNSGVSNSGPNNKIETPPTEKTNSTVQNNRQEIPVVQKPVVTQQQPIQNVASVNNNISNSRKEPAVNQKSTTQPQQTNSNTVSKTTTTPVTEPKSENKTSNPVVTTNKISTSQPAINKELPQNVAVRKSETIQNLYFHGDSLVLSLYDNGVVDGDTVSVFMNGNPIISQQQLKVTASKKTIYITPEMDSVQIVLFADNLGSIPPNTGLLTVRDGDNVYNVRFSADLQKNAAIVLRRKK